MKPATIAQMIVHVIMPTIERTRDDMLFDERFKEALYEFGNIDVSDPEILALVHSLIYEKFKMKVRGTFVDVLLLQVGDVCTMSIKPRQ